MTNAKIIKAMAYCNSSERECKKCPYYSTSNCSKNMINDALNLIIRQQSEIEELEEKHWNECMQIAQYDDKLREAKSNLVDAGDLVIHQKKEIDDLSNAKPEAIKEFVETLKTEIQHLSKVNLYGNTFALVNENIIDKIVEKFVV